MKKISIISPAYNEEDNVRACYEAVRTLFEGPLAGYEREHIFADNASADATADILREIAASDPHVKVILNSRNFGGSRSLYNALRYATGDAILVLLAVDLQDPPEMLVEFVRLWESGYEIVAGARAVREEGFLLRASRGIFYRLINLLSDIDLPVNVGEFQLIDRKVWEAVLQRDDHYPYVRGIIASVGFRRVIVPYTWKARTAGISKHNFSRLINEALNGIFAFTNAPLRLCTYLGLALAAFCLLYAFGATIAYFIRPDVAPPGVATLIVSLFFLSGVQLAFIGILGEYVTAIHSQVRRGPMVIERERINVADEPQQSARTAA
ncbi:glycosyltransferase family 2 protein [Sphingomonas sp.]|uniref:glycosyltransferase family 2 protein n=1 Tax=Sphingomonas sp. TaxID=28214 RepID=UPI002FC775F3